MKGLFGRQVIYCDFEEINAGNVIEFIDKTRAVHLKNATEIDYLYRYYKGDQPILYRKKDVRPEICNKIVENRAKEIVSFEVGYLCGEPIQYISRKGDSQVGKNVGLLNDMMLTESKSSKDRDLIEWQKICGTAYRLVLASEFNDEESPFNIYTLDPRKTYVAYSSKIGNKRLAGVFCGTSSDGNTVYSIYTDRSYFEIVDRKISVEKRHGLGFEPIIEYPSNTARLGSFEPVLPILDALNTISSNRVDGVEQFIQSLVKFINCEIDEEKYAELLQLGAIQIRSVDGQKADVEILTQELNQQQTQTLVEYLYQTVLTICGMPNRNGNGSSTSDTGAASLLRDGWTMAESRAKDSELMFKQSEREFLRIVLLICRTYTDIKLKLSDVETKFTRRNYENIQTKAQVLCEMLNNEKIDPKLAFSHCGMFTDAEDAYTTSMKWYEQQQKELQKSLKEDLNNGRNTESVQAF